MANRSKCTPKKRAAFLQAIAETCNVTKACKLSRLSRRTVYQWKADDQKFAAEWEAALKVGADTLEDEAVRRAREGTLKPVFYQGVKCGSVREYSDTLMIFLLKGAKPEKYSERLKAELTGKDGGPIQTKNADLSQLSDDELEQLKQLVAKSRGDRGGGTSTP